MTYGMASDNRRLFFQLPLQRCSLVCRYAFRFAVTPLTEDCGILEWVPRTGTLRSAVQGIYQQEGFYDPRRTNTTIDGMYKQHEHKYQVPKETAAHDGNPTKTTLVSSHQSTTVRQNSTGS